MRRAPRTNGSAELRKRPHRGVFCLVRGRIDPAMHPRNFILLNSVGFRRFPATLAFLLLTLGLCTNMRAQKSTRADDPQVQQLYAEAKSAQAQGDLAGAAAKYESLLQVAPNLGPVYNNLGALYLQQREYKRAAAILEKGLKVDPKMNSASALLGISLYEMGDYPNARRNLESALRANPKDYNAELFLSNDLIKLGAELLYCRLPHLDRPIGVAERVMRTRLARGKLDCFLVFKERAVEILHPFHHFAGNFVSVDGIGIDVV